MACWLHRQPSSALRHNTTLQPSSRATGVRIRNGLLARLAAERATVRPPDEDLDINRELWGHHVQRGSEELAFATRHDCIDR